jgi:prevent-host-death family protein
MFDVQEVSVSVITSRDLARRTRDVLDEVEKTGSPAIVTRSGRPAVAVIPLDVGALEDFVLSTSIRYLADMREADLDLAAGRTVSLDDLMGNPPLKRQRKVATARSRSRR